MAKQKTKTLQTNSNFLMSFKVDFWYFQGTFFEEKPENFQNRIENSEKQKYFWNVHEILPTALQCKITGEKSNAKRKKSSFFMLKFLNYLIYYTFLGITIKLWHHNVIKYA